MSDEVYSKLTEVYIRYSHTDEAVHSCHGKPTECQKCGIEHKWSGFLSVELKGKNFAYLIPLCEPCWNEEAPPRTSRPVLSLVSDNTTRH
jgi:hypothetical protein